MRTTKGKKIRNNLNKKNGNNKRDKFKTIEKEKCVSETREINYEELKKSKTLERKLRKGNEMVCVECGK